MEQTLKDIIKTNFKRLIENYGFTIDFNESEQLYIISSNVFVIEIEKYFRELYTTLYKTDDSKNGINLFNLLEYLRQDHQPIILSESFRNEKDIYECYKKQLQLISVTVENNYFLISAFYDDESYGANVIGFENYWKNKHPEFYEKTI